MRPLLLAAVLAGSAAAQAPQTPGVEGAQAAVRAYVDDFAAGDVAGAVQRIDPVEVEAFADLLRALSDRMGDPGDEVPKGQPPAKTVAAFIEGVFGAQALGMDLDSVEGGVIGAVLESDSLAHVVTRSSASVMGGTVGVTTARWDGARWWVSFGDKLDAFRQSLSLFDGAAGSE